MNTKRISAKQLGHLVRSKIISPREVIDDCRIAVENYNHLYNAFVYLNWEDAYKEAAELEKKIMDGDYVGPFAGVPIGLKDFLPIKKGWPATHGGVRSLQTIDTEDSLLYSTMHKLGCVAVGKTNAPSFGFRGITDNKMFGPTSTPFKIGYNSAGSSGGSGAAVGASLVPMASAGDAGGSTRLPAAWCSCYGFKPSAGVNPSICRPDSWTATHPYCCDGPITRTVEDCAVVLQSMRQFSYRDPISVPSIFDERIYTDALDLGVKDMRIGVTFNFDLFPMPDVQIAKNMHRVIKLLGEAGAHVELVQFVFKSSRQEIEHAWLQGISIDSAVDFMLWKQNGTYNLDEHLEDYPEEFLRWNEIASQSTILDYRKYHEIATEVLDAHMDVFDQGYDVLIAPVSGCLPVKNATDNNTLGPSIISGEEVDPLIGFAYTYLENMIGFPAASVPIALSDENLPIGLQVIGKRYRDTDVLRVSAELERINPWDQFYDEIDRGGLK